MSEEIYVLEGETLNKGFTFYMALNGGIALDAWREAFRYLREHEKSFGDPWKKDGRLDMSKWRIMKYRAVRVNKKPTLIFKQRDL